MTDEKEFDRSKVEVDNMTRRGEDVDGDEPEAGRYDTGTQGTTNRPTGSSTSRDYTGVDPQETVSHDDQDRSPAG